MKTYCIGDIHGRIEALKEVLTKCKFDYKKDKLIILGDVCDGGKNTYDVVEELLKIKNKHFILGNHDQFLLDYINTGFTDRLWINQGGSNTLNSYGGVVIPSDYIIDEPKFKQIENINIPLSHKHFFNNYKLFKLINNCLFVHGGVDLKKSLIDQSRHNILWDRELCEHMFNGGKIYNNKSNNDYKNIKKIFVGHTTTQRYNNNLEPTIFTDSNNQKVIMLDTGAGWNGKLTIMNIDTEEYWQSEIQNPAV